MKKRKLILFFCTMLLSCAIGMTAFAKNMDLTADVPNWHKVLIVSDGGKIFLDDEVRSGLIELPRHKEQTYRIECNPGKAIREVQYNYQNVTEDVKNGIYTAPKLVRDTEFKVIYTDVPISDVTLQSPPTGDFNKAMPWAVLLLMCGAGIVWIRGKRRASY